MTRFFEEPSDDPKQPPKIKYQTYIHTFEFYGIAEECVDIIANGSKTPFDDGEAKRNFQPLFNLFALKYSKDDKSLIPFNAFYRSKEKYQIMEKGDNELAEMVIKDNTRIFISYLAQIAYSNPSTYPLDDIFDTKFGGGAQEFSTIRDKF